MTTQRFAAYCRHAFVVLLAGCFVCTLNGCGGGSEPAAGGPGVATTAAPGEAAKATAALPALDPNAPVTMDVLRLMPASAQAAIALPPFQTVENKMLPLVKRFLPDPASVDAVYGEWVKKLGEEMGVPNAQTLKQLTDEVGINAEGPVAFFADLGPLAESYVANLKLAPESPEPSAEDGAPAEDDAAAEPAEADAGAADPMQFSKAQHQMDLGQPFYAVVMNINDESKAEAQIKKAVEKDAGLAGKEPETLEEDGVTITSYDPEKFSYFFLDKKFVMSNHLAMLKEVAARFKEPATFRFGTETAPALEKDQAVGLLFGQRLIPVMEKLKAGIPADDETQQPILLQIDAMSTAMRTTGAEDDPWIMDLALDDKRIQIQSRIDTATHPGVLESSGPATPLSLAPLLPEKTLAFLSIRFSEISKKQMKDVYLKSMGGMEGGIAQGMGIAREALDRLEDEITIGVAASESGLPASLLVMANLTDPKATLDMLAMFAPTTLKEEYNGAQIMDVQSLSPVPLSLVVLDKTVVLSNDVAEIKKIIDLKKDGKTSAFFAKLDPPLAPETPRYSGFLLNSNLVSEVLMPLSVLMGGLPPDVDARVKTGANVLREVRMLTELQGPWAISSINFYLNDAAAVAPEAALEAAPAPAAQ